MREFTCDILPSRIRFGQNMDGVLAQEAERLGLKKLLVLSTPFQKQDALDVARKLGDRAVDVFSDATMHTPVHVTETAMELVKKVGADGLVSFGGGSTTGLGKAIALRTGLPQIALPTTYAGSEVTPLLGETENGVKKTLRDVRVLPNVVIYDVSRTLGLPEQMTMTSGLNAIAHAIAALYAQDANPVSTMMASSGIASMVSALRRLKTDLTDADARADALYGAWMCGAVLGQVGMSLHHKLCHTLGGTFDLPHSETHSIILPHATAFNAKIIRPALEPLAQALGHDKPGVGLFELAQELGVPTRLKDIGMPEDGIDRAADIAMQNKYWNPREIERGSVRRLIEKAYHGIVPLR